MNSSFYTGRFLVGICACVGCFVVGLAVERSLNGDIVAKAQSPEYVAISSSTASGGSPYRGIYLLKSNGDVEVVDEASNQRILHRRIDAKVDNAKDLRAKFNR